MREIEVVGTLMPIDGEMKLVVVAFSRNDETWNQVVGKHIRSYKDKSQGRSQLNSITKNYIDKGYYVSDTKGLGY